MLNPFGNFNSIKVQLKLELGVLCVHLYQFQFHKGTIKTIQQMTIREFCLNFNSIKVQLKRAKRSFTSSE